MATDGTARINIDLAGRDKIRAGLNGAASEVRRTQRQLADGSRQTTAAAVRDARGRFQAVARAARDEAIAVKRGEEEKRRQIRDTAREAERSAAAQARAVVRARREAGGGGASRQQGRGADGRFQPMGMGESALNRAMGAAAGLFTVQAALSQVTNALDAAVGALRAQARAPSVEEQLTQGLQFEDLIARTTRQAMQSAPAEDVARRRGQVTEEILSTAMETNTSPMEIARGLQVWQETFSEFDFGVATMREVARGAQAMNVEFSDAVNILGEARSKYDLTNEQTREFFAILASQGLEGKVTPAMMAREFAPVFAQHRTFTGRGGIEGFRELGALSQVVAEVGGGTIPEAATRTQGFLTQLSDPNTQDRLAEMTGGRRRRRRDPLTGLMQERVEGGIQVRDRGGNVRPIADIVEEMAGHRAFARAENIGLVFRDLEGRRAASDLISRARADRAAGREFELRRIQRVDSAAGAQFNELAFQDAMATNAAAQRRTGVMGEVTAAREGAGRAGAFTTGMAVSQAFQDTNGLLGNALQDVASFGSSGLKQEAQGAWFRMMEGIMRAAPGAERRVQEMAAEGSVGAQAMVRARENLIGAGASPAQRARVEAELSQSTIHALGQVIGETFRVLGFGADPQPQPGSGGGRLQPGGAARRTPGGG